MAKDNAATWLTDDGLVRVAGWARDGLTYEQIAECMGIGKRTLSTWREKYPTLAEALNTHREVADRHVENALYQRAIGYEYTERKTLIRENPDGTRQREVTETKKRMAPDVVAQIFWLKNRKPSEWRDRREVELDGAVGLVQIVDDIGGGPDPLS